MDCFVRTTSAVFLAIFLAAAHASSASASDDAARSAQLAWSSSSVMKFPGLNFHVKSPGEEEAKKTLLIPSANCTATFNGKSTKYENCLELSGGFKLLWNVMNHSATNGANVSMMFSGSFGDNWIGFGPSAEGEMTGDSAVISRPGTNGTIAKQYYLKARTPSEVVPGGNLMVYGIQSELVNSIMAVSFTLNLNHELYEKSLFIWANGPYNEAEGDTLQPHKSSYVGLISLSGTAAAPGPDSSSVSLRPNDAFRALIFGMVLLFIVLLA